MANAPANGRLTLQQIAEGLRCVVENVSALVSDAELMFENQRYARTLSLSVSALEESGKVSVLSAMSSITSRTQSMWRHRWREFRSHSVKSVHGRAKALPDQARENLYTLAQEIPALAGTGTETEELRQSGLYVDYQQGSSTWSTPSDISREAALELLKLARSARERLSLVRSRGLHSEEVLKVKHEIYGPFAARYPVDDLEAIRAIGMQEYLRAAEQAHEAFYDRLSELGFDWNVGAHEP